MKIDFDEAREAIAKHPGAKGNSFEEIVREFIKKYLPKNLEIMTGFIIDSTGKQSKQMNIIIADAAKTPIFYEKSNLRVVPVETVYSVIEVKARLDNPELQKVFDNMKSVRVLEKRAYYKPSGAITYSDSMYVKEWDIWPINYFVFAFDSIEMSILAELIEKKHQLENCPSWSRIDTICVLNKGVICNKIGEMFDALPTENSIIAAIITENALLLFYTLIVRYLNQVRLPNFNFKEYLGQMQF